jgi:pimeloyl-ACP methyl ester carboxylesterase
MQLADSDSRFIEVNGLTGHCKIAGQSSPAILLLHGFGAGVFSWREVMEPLSPYGMVVAFDRPAFGLTSRPMPSEWTGLSPYSREAQSDLTVALMDKLGIEKAILIGHSAGGTIAALTTLRHPERVQALILVDPAIYPHGRAEDWVRYLSFLPEVQRLGPLLVRSIASDGNSIVRSARHDVSKITPAIFEGYRKPLKAENWDRALWEYTIANHPLSLEKQLDKLTMPVLVITGDDDRIIPTAESIRLAQGYYVPSLQSSLTAVISPMRNARESSWMPLQLS